MTPTAYVQFQRSRWDVPAAHGAGDAKSGASHQDYSIGSCAARHCPSIPLGFRARRWLLWSHATPLHVPILGGIPQVNLAWLRIGDDRLGNRLPLRFYNPCWTVRSDDSAVRALSPLPEAKLPQVDALACLDQALEDSVRFSGRAALVTHRGDLAGLLTIENIQAAIVTRLIARSRTALRPDLTVVNMMTQWADVSVIQRAWMSVASIDDVLWIFSRNDATHLVVVDGNSRAVDAVCGWISRVELLRRLDCR